MLRGIIGVIVSYIAMAVVITVLFFGGFFLLGVDRFFQPDSYAVSPLWMGISVVISMTSAILGGYVCAVISQSMKACKALALIVFILGIVLCLPKMWENPHVRAGDVPAGEVMNLAQMPVWMHLLLPTLGAVCVLFGARMKKTARLR